MLICQSLKVHVLEFCSLVRLHHVESQISEYPFVCRRHLATGLGFERYCPGRLCEHVYGSQQKSMSVVVLSDAPQIDQIGLNEVGYSLAVDLSTPKSGI